MLIKNYGLFWERKVVDWSRRRGPLLGLGVRKKRQDPVDFTYQRGIYCLYDDNFRLIYVGQAGGRDDSERGIYRRMWSHTRNDLAQRWTRFSWFGIREPDERANGKQYRELLEYRAPEGPLRAGQILDQFESVMILAAEPARNFQSRSFGGDAHHYRQFDPSIGGSDDPDAEELEE
ncbi:MAG TPA: GIY-YIG nuclease family protein [Microvirga sp.]|nr:GIY-YIG nuclease family protein [Microvirga sp.]